MTLEYFQSNPNHWAMNFTSHHFVHTPLPGDKHLFEFTGAVKLDWEPQSQNWQYEQLRLHVNFPNVFPQGKWYQIEQWAPFFTLNGVDKGGDNHNGGWAIDDFGVDGGSFGGKVAGSVTIWANIRARGVKFSIFGIGYTLTLIGEFTEPPPLPTPDPSPK